MAMTEADLRAEVVMLAHAAGWLVFSLPIAKTRRPVKDAIGYPDLTLARDGMVLWMELKTEDGRLRPDQGRWAGELPVGRVHVIRPSHLTDWTLAKLLANGHA